VDDRAAGFNDVVMRGVHQRSAPHDEREVLQTDVLRCVPARLGGRAEEQVCAGLAVRGLVCKFIGGMEVRLESDKWHQRVVAALRQCEVGHIDAQVAQYGISIR
jgi:ArsR family metal-binding transcriptional regulator